MRTLVPPTGKTPSPQSLPPHNGNSAQWPIDPSFKSATHYPRACNASQSFLWPPQAAQSANIFHPSSLSPFPPGTVLSPHSSDHQKVPDKQSLLSIRSTFPISQSASSRIHQSESANLRRLANQERTARARKFPPPEPNSTSAAIHLTSHCHLRPPVRSLTPFRHHIPIASDIVLCPSPTKRAQLPSTDQLT
uniref:Uncharacterized protein n=1 Tax=Globodera rostochiensis TaxID=31243 RepID=A0A914I7X8_GLORO